MSMSFKYHSSSTKLVEDPLSPLSIEPNTSTSKTVLHTEKLFDDAIYETFFQSTIHPAMIIDLNVNPQKASPYIFNPAAASLISFSNCNIFTESRLDDFKGSLYEFLNISKRKVAEKITHIDILHLRVKKGIESSEAIFSFSATSFDVGEEVRMLGIILMEISKTVKEELDALSTFQASLISALSHELNNPLNSLILLLNMMPNTYREENKKENLKEMALASGNILQNKIRDIIDYAKIEMDNVDLIQCEFFVDELFEELKQMFKYEIDMKYNELITKITSSGNNRLKILGDRNKIEQVLVKLLSNANKYTNKGIITLTAVESKANFNVTFTVKDTGQGISKDKLDLLFETLKQKAKHPETSNRLPGLGLSIAKSICECMDSTLEVLSAEGTGTKFSFELPVCRITNFEKPSSAKKKVRQPLFTLSKSVLRRLNHAMEEEKIYLIDKEHQLLNTILSSDGQLEDLLPATEITKSVKFRKDTSRIFRNCKPDVISSLKFIKELDTDALDENIQVYQTIPRYNNNGFAKGVNRTKQLQSKKSTVLIVDDMYLNRMAIREVLRKMNIPTTEAINGEKAVNIVEASFKDNTITNISLILMDLNMPVMTGLEATMAIRKLEKNYERVKSIPIVAITAHGATYGKDECIKAGMQDCEAKPVSKNTLTKIIKRHAPKLIFKRQAEGKDRNKFKV